MSTDIAEIEVDNNDSVLMTQFFGGQDRGKCLQLGQTRICEKRGLQMGSVQLTKEQAMKLHEELGAWLHEEGMF